MPEKNVREISIWEVKKKSNETGEGKTTVINRGNDTIKQRKSENRGIVTD